MDRAVPREGQGSDGADGPNGKALGKVKELLDFAALPEDSVARRKVLEKRAQPHPDKPTLDPETEAGLAEIDERSAQCYIKNEEAVYRMRRLSQRVGHTVPTPVRLASEGV